MTILSVEKGVSEKDPSPSPKSYARSVTVSAVAVPFLVLTGFAMLAIIPVGLLVRGTLRDPALRGLRGWAAILATVYATPLVLWAILPDRAASLTKDMHPAFVPVIVAAAVVFIAADVVRRHRISTSQGAKA